jgi:hypothetical protein
MKDDIKIAEELPLVEEVERKLPFFIDIFLYPLTISGLVNMAVFLVVPILIGLIQRFVLGWIYPVGDLISLILYALFFGYILYYLRLCVIDSSKGFLRAPDVKYWLWPDKSDLISQFFMALASIAICFCPASLYFTLTERADAGFWLLFALGLFFFPISFLRVCLFDSFDSLNPLAIIKSIYNNFLPYLPLILVFSILALACYVLLPGVPEAGSDLRGLLYYLTKFINYLVGLRFVSRMLILFYLTMIAAHLLGRFYWLNKYKLNWGL